MSGYPGEDDNQNEMFADALNNEEQATMCLLYLIRQVSPFLDDLLSKMVDKKFSFSEDQRKKIADLAGECAVRKILLFNEIEKQKELGTWDKLTPLEQYELRISYGLNVEEDQELYTILVLGAGRSIPESQEMTMAVIERSGRGGRDYRNPYQRREPWEEEGVEYE